MYPTIRQVEEAGQLQLCRWQRFLEPPGQSAVNESGDAFERIFKLERTILERIVEKVKEGGGLTPEISKKIGWK